MDPVKNFTILLICLALIFPSLAISIVVTRERVPLHDNERIIVNPDTGDAIYWGNELIPSFVQHEHSGHATVHMHLFNIVADANYILVDLSNDGGQWKHGTDGVLVHIEFIDVEVDPDLTGKYNIGIWYLDNCSDTDCDSHMTWGAEGSQNVGNVLEKSIDWGTHGPLCYSGIHGHLTNHSILNDVSYQTDVLMKSTADSGTATVYPGNGDLILKIDWVAGTFDAEVNMSYHIHTLEHF